MKKHKQRRLPRLVLGVYLAVAAQDRGLQVLAAEQLGPRVSLGKQYALCIAIDRYRTWPALARPVAEHGSSRASSRSTTTWMR